VPETAVQWRVIAWYDSHDQAKAASAFLRGSYPRAFEFAALTHEGEAVWREKGEDYGVEHVRL